MYIVDDFNVNDVDTVNFMVKDIYMVHDVDVQSEDSADFLV